MEKSPFVNRLDEIQSALAVKLKILGFRKKGRTFNRSGEEGIVQVINLQTGQFPVGESKLPPNAAHLRPDLYGKFAVNLGVHIREIWEQESKQTYPRTIREYHCQIRARLGQIDGRKEYWWSLNASASNIVEDVSLYLFDSGISFLESFEDRQAILKNWIVLNEGERHLSRRARVDVAIMLAKRGDGPKATQLLNAQISGTTLKGHIKYVRKLAHDLGLGELNTKSD